MFRYLHACDQDHVKRGFLADLFLDTPGTVLLMEIIVHLNSFIIITTNIIIIIILIIIISVCVRVCTSVQRAHDGV